MAETRLSADVYCRQYQPVRILNRGAPIMLWPIIGAK